MPDIPDYPLDAAQETIVPAEPLKALLMSMYIKKGMFKAEADMAASRQIEADLVLCAPVVEQEASKQKIDLVAHYAHLLVHGTLHAQGYDHEQDDEAACMEARETEVLAGLGFGDPYA